MWSKLIKGCDCEIEIINLSGKENREKIFYWNFMPLSSIMSQF